MKFTAYNHGMIDEASTQNGKKRRSMQFGLRAMFVIVLFSCLAMVGYKRYQDKVNAEAALRESHRPLSSISISDGQIILVRKGNIYGGLVIRSQQVNPEVMRYEWWYREDGSGKVFTNEQPVKHGIGMTTMPASDINIHFGPFDLWWSGNEAGKGWFYFPMKNSELKIAIPPPQNIESIDAASDKLVFKNLADFPTKSNFPLPEASK